MNLRHFYDCLDWSKVNDAQLAKELGVSRQSINAARRQRGHAALSHGGKRPGAGRKAKAPSEPANAGGMAAGADGPPMPSERKA